MKKKYMILAVAAVSLGVTEIASAAFVENFDSLSLGSINGQNGWSATGPYDQAVANTGGGNQALRLSNALTSGSFGDQVFTAHSGEIAGEGAAFNRFYGDFDFWSVTGAAQAGLRLTISPDNGSGGRQSFIAIEDSGTGLDLQFFDYDTGIGDFSLTTVATNLSYTDIHNLAFEVLFEDGASNDTVNIYVDGSLAHTGTSWEDYYRDWQPANSPVSIDTLLFRMSGTAAPATLGNGYYIDNLSVGGSVVPVPAAAPLGLMGMALVGYMRRRKAA